jgi:hypothetical protein
MPVTPAVSAMSSGFVTIGDPRLSRTPGQNKYMNASRPAPVLAKGRRLSRNAGKRNLLMLPREDCDPNASGAGLATIANQSIPTTIAPQVLSRSPTGYGSLSKGKKQLLILTNTSFE